MRIALATGCAALLLLTSRGPALGQEAPPTFPAKTEVVILDMVARDKGGTIVTDLRAGEVEVREEGVLCPIEGASTFWETWAKSRGRRDGSWSVKRTTCVLGSGGLGKG